MDVFVKNKLTAWGLSEWIPRFEDEGVDRECLYCLGDQEINELITKVGPRAKFKKQLKLLQEEQNRPDLETVDSSAQVCPSVSGTSNTGKRGLDLQCESSHGQPLTKQWKPTLDSFSEQSKLSHVTSIMRSVNEKVPDQGNKLNKFLKSKIHDLETDKRELVGVFGRTGDGKSSLINAIIGVKDLLPSGYLHACTTAMIKVEANMQNQNYEATIEFITKEQWKDELWSVFLLFGDNGDDQEKEDEKLSALYGEEWKNKSCENLMDNKYFREIPQFLQSTKKHLTCETAKELSAKLAKYTRTASTDRESQEIKKWYWPLVKCVTVRVPHNDLHHVTLVDLPGNGDRNKSRDQMWKQIVASCSTVWIVADINRGVGGREAWEILESVSHFMGNGGECRHIHFICTKSDVEGVLSDNSAAGVHDFILQRNAVAKEEVRGEFRKLNKDMKQFSDECFDVFTVSSKEFRKRRYLAPAETEIPKLKAFLQDLSDNHSELLNYVSGAYGILSLIQGARCREGTDRGADVCTDLKEKMRLELDKVKEPMEKTYETFEKCLSKGVENSKKSCEKVLISFLYPRKSGSAFHKTLRSVVVNGGSHKPKKQKEINLNVKLSSKLTESIDEEFRKTFPNEGKHGPFNEAIHKFSLGTETMRKSQEYKDVELQLLFLKTEEEKLKTELNKIVRDRKKNIYSSLTTTIEEMMEECYKKAADIRGQDALKKMRDTIVDHVHQSMSMFEEAQKEVLNQLRDLMEEILKKLEKRMQESIELSLKTDSDSLPDVTEEFWKVKELYKELKGSTDEELLI